MIAASSITPACAGSRCARGVAIHKPAYAAGRRLLASSTRGRTMVASAAIDPDNASILVAGGGGVALEVVRKLKDMGSWVWMLQRTDNRRAEVEAMKAIVVNGDALDKPSLEKAFGQIDDLDAVVSTIGGTTQNPQADSQGNINVIEEAAKRGVKKFILVTSIGTGDSKDAVSEDVYSILQPVLEQKVLAEDRLKELGEQMNFVIIRPGGLKSEPETGNGALTEDTSVCGSIHRGDVADLVVKALVSEKGDRKVLSAIDKEQVFHNATFQEFVL